MIPDDKILFTFTRYPGAVAAGKVGEEFSEIAEERKLNIHRIRKLVEGIDPEWFPFGCIIDLQRLVKLAGEDEDSGNLQALSILARIKLQGTDGIRGRIVNENVTKRQALERFIKEGILTPGFFALNAEAFGLYLQNTGAMETGDSVLVGEDGRDRLTHRTVVPAVLRGLNTVGCKVLDAGIIPTPGVPIAARHWGCRAGIIITASHNPSNQNGIKLLHDSFKLMDDGVPGEFGLTRVIYALAEEDGDWSGDETCTDISTEANALLERVILENISFPKKVSRPVTVAYDGANGAFSEMAPRILKTLPVETTILNVDAGGFNINQDGGVGEIEGTASFSGDLPPEEFEAYFPVIKSVFQSGRSNPGGLHVGIVNDGDGDRGYLLVYDSSEDSVLVVPGDELAMLILKKRDSEGALESGAFMVNSVESDIMAASYAHSEYGVSNETACVGDKWLLKPAREGRPFIVGCEESGHVTFAVDVPDPDNRRGTVFTGNGLLSALTALEYALEANLSAREIAEPFPRGHKAIRYVYFVDKERFLPGTEAFIAAGDAALKSLEAGLQPRGFDVRLIPFADAPEMLYVAAFDSDGAQVGALFVRNSGTESKTGVAIRCRPDLEGVFESAMDEVHQLNAEVLKDEDSLEYGLERRILVELAGKPLQKSNLRETLDERNLSPITNGDFDALLYAMRKQRLIDMVGDTIQLSKT